MHVRPLSGARNLVVANFHSRKKMKERFGYLARKRLIEHQGSRAHLHRAAQAAEFDLAIAANGARPHNRG
jgi:hypothetical protein